MLLSRLNFCNVCPATLLCRHFSYTEPTFHSEKEKVAKTNGYCNPFGQFGNFALLFFDLNFILGVFIHINKNIVGSFLVRLRGKISGPEKPLNRAANRCWRNFGGLSHGIDSHLAQNRNETRPLIINHSLNSPL